MMRSRGRHRSPGRAGAAPGSADIWRPTGACRARHCAGTTIQLRGAIHTMALPGNPRGRAFRYISPGCDAGRRRIIGAVAILQLSTARPRRWCDAGSPEADQKAGAPGSHGGGSRSSRSRAWTSERDPDVVPSSRLPEIAPLDNDRRCFPPNRNTPQCRTLIKNGTSGHGQPHVLPRERGQDAHRGVPGPPLSTRVYGLHRACRP